MLKIGSVIDGKYKILNVIGKGGMSTVYLAVNERANRPWAIKEIQKKNLRIYDRNRKEIEMMKQLQHPNLPGIADVLECGSSILIVMDYIEGQTLEEILQERKVLSEAQVRNLALQLCDALGYLHSREPPIIYRDMKPSNVILKPDGKAMLIDFGAAREFQAENLKDTVLLGTLGYAAPEQYLEWDQSDVRTDIYCLGMMMFQLLTGESPHKLVPIRTINPNLSGGLEVIVQTCTKVNKEERYQSCTDLIFALEHYWELDAGYRREQKKKLKLFLGILGIALVFGITAALFAGMEAHLRKSNYEAYLLAAQNSVTKKDEIENYKKAITLDPKREDAYCLLLKQGFLDDGFLEVKESEELRKILIDYGEHEMTNEASFLQNKKGYARFAYEAGIAYFYKFEERENKKNAAGYFKIAVEAKGLDEQSRERAKRLYLISEYYSRVGTVDEAGDLFISYEQYWKDLTALAAGNLVEIDNARTALVTYREIVGQILTRCADFQSAGIQRQDMEAQLGNIREHLQTDFEEYKRESGQPFEEEQKKLLELLEQAENMLVSVYGENSKED